MTPIEKAIARVVEIANGEIGYVEKATNSQLNDKTANPGSGNYTKYGAYFDSQRGEYEYYNGRKNGYDWCDQFVDWCFAQAFGIDAGRRALYQPMNSCGAGCKYSAGYFRANNAWSSVPRVGDQIFFGPKGDESHTGIVVALEPGKVHTVEGNAANRVMRRTYSTTDSHIAGYGEPNFELVAYQFVEPPTPDTPIMDDSEAVTMPELEKILEARLGPQIDTIADVPHKSVAAITRTLLDLQAVDGGTPYSVNPDDIYLPYNVLRAIVICVRYVDKRLQEMEGGKDG